MTSSAGKGRHWKITASGKSAWLWKRNIVVPHMHKIDLKGETRHEGTKWERRDGRRIGLKHLIHVWKCHSKVHSFVQWRWANLKIALKWLYLYKKLQRHHKMNLWFSQPVSLTDCLFLESAYEKLEIYTNLKCATVLHRVPTGTDPVTLYNQDTKHNATNSPWWYIL